MNLTDLTELTTILDACQLHPCAECGEQTLHSVDQVLEQYGPATKLLVRCTYCDAQQQVWDIA